MDRWRDHTRHLPEIASKNLYTYKFGLILADSDINGLGAWNGHINCHKSNIDWTNSYNPIEI